MYVCMYMYVIPFTHIFLRMSSALARSRCCSSSAAKATTASSIRVTSPANKEEDEDDKEREEDPVGGLERLLRLQIQSNTYIHTYIYIIQGSK
jgi:hypothetical protein